MCKNSTPTLKAPNFLQIVAFSTNLARIESSRTGLSIEAGFVKNGPVLRKLQSVKGNVLSQKMPLDLLLEMVSEFVDVKVRCLERGGLNKSTWRALDNIRSRCFLIM